MITKETIQSTKHTEWDFLNGILYKMCEENFTHDEKSKTIGKIMLIGRVYAAAIERRKNKSEPNDEFYIEKVAPKFRTSLLDFYLNELKTKYELSEKSVPFILKVHYYLTQLIFDLTKQHKRSFVSKYLHFHLPNFFFIYDTRAVEAIGLLKIKLPTEIRELTNSEGVDKDYAIFYYKCFELKRRLNAENDYKISNRHIDNILMRIIELKEK